MSKKTKQVNPMAWVFLAIVLGIASALIWGEKMSFLAPIGNIFINLIKMCCVPLVMCSIMKAVANMNDMRKLGRIGGKMLGLYVAFGAVSGILGLILAFATNLGSGITPSNAEEVEAQSFSVLEVIVNMVPSNVFSAMSNFELLPCIVFSIFFGIALTMIGKKAEPVLEVLDGALEAIYKIIEMVMKISPIGIFALLAAGIGSSGKEVLSTLGVLIILVGIGCGLLLVIYAIVTKVSSGVPMKKIIMAYIRVAATAFSTRSSSATLPLTMTTATEDLNCDKEVASFTLPVGCTINMNGFICELCLIAVLAGNFYGSPLSLGQCLIAVVISTLSGIGMPGIPNGGAVFYVVLFGALGLPNGALIAMLLGVESLMDMICTMANVCGDMAAASVISASEGRGRVQ